MGKAHEKMSVVGLWGKAVPARRLLDRGASYGVVLWATGTGRIWTNIRWFVHGLKKRRDSERHNTIDRAQHTP